MTFQLRNFPDRIRKALREVSGAVVLTRRVAGHNSHILSPVGEFQMTLAPAMGDYLAQKLPYKGRTKTLFQKLTTKSVTADNRWLMGGNKRFPIPNKEGLQRWPRNISQEQRDSLPA